jgi:hydroxymethylbilane synthase
LRPDVAITLFRGNVATRLGRLEAGEADATLLAAAGLARLGITDRGTPVPIDVMLPAPAQGAVGIETLRDNEEVRALLSAIDHADTSDCVRAERAVLEALGGTCHSPIAALAQIEGESISLRAEILSPDGREHVAMAQTFVRNDREAALAIGAELLSRASPELRALFSA